MKEITDYWHKYYVNKDHCSLCGNSGIIDTTGVTTVDNRIYHGAIIEVGKKNFCICPNGQSMRNSEGDKK
jgi:hypothetical protein